MATRKDAIAADFYHGYINAAKSDDVLKAIKTSTKDFKKLLADIPKKKIDYAYAEGKWTIRELIQHIIDAERVFTYRALRFARKDATPLQSFDEKSWTENSQANSRKWKDMVDEFKAVREATECLFKSFNEDQLLSKGIASNKEINVLALGFISAGHVEHHINIIKERYL
ncbi:MAG: DinB family protein [Bacteroidetes bacterium]|nr:DinB family protein [Bacteroidota bacterium]MBS1934167.1 DinB family protein [Bacteroidota bacterium]